LIFLDDFDSLITGGLSFSDLLGGDVLEVAAVKDNDGFNGFRRLSMAELVFEF
jgi:hypothetical protein